MCLFAAFVFPVHWQVTSTAFETPAPSTTAVYRLRGSNAKEASFFVDVEFWVSRWVLMLWLFECWVSAVVVIDVM
jgi:hypothetical protein